MISFRLPKCLALVPFAFLGLLAGAVGHTATKPSTVIFGGEAAYPPFEWLDKGKPKGLNVDLERAIARAGGARAEHSLGDWVDVIQDLHGGRVDVVAMFHSKEREQDFLFTQPFTFVHHAIYSTTRSPNVDSLDDLSGVRVAVERYSYAHQQIIASKVPARMILTRNTVQALEAVRQEHADYAILSEPAANYMIKSRGWALRATGSPIWPAAYAFAVRKDRPDLVEWLDKNIDAIEESGQFREIEERWQVAPARRGKAEKWLVAILTIVVPLGGWWIWSLRRRLSVHTKQLSDEVSLRKEAETKADWASNYHIDTKMPQQHHFIDLASHWLAKNTSDERKQVVALKLAELDHIIHTKGHDEGQRAIQSVAKRLLEVGFPACGQLGKDVFTIIANKRDITREFSPAVASHDTAILKTPYPPIFAGVATWPQHGETVAELATRAESALAKAVERRERWVEFRASMEPNTEALRLLSLFRDRGASVIYPMFQPQIDLATGAIVGAEALARWEVAGIGHVSPADFIPLLEEAGLIRHVTRRMIREAVRVSAILRDAGQPVPISVNVTANDLLGWKLSRTILKTVSAHGSAAAKDLKLELTERGVVDRPEVLQWKMKRLVKRGVSISIDDFGTGHSSLTHLSHFPVCEIKIDKSFISNMVNRERDMGIVKSTIAMGHQLGLTVVAEGVETEEILNILRRYGCDRAQGFAISRPLSERTFIDFVQRNSKAAHARGSQKVTAIHKSRRSKRH